MTKMVFTIFSSMSWSPPRWWRL